MEEFSMSEKASDEDMQADQDQMLSELGGSLRTLFNKNARLREDDEKRMLNSLRQYYGKYDGNVHFEGTQSKAFINITRNKTNAAAARLQEMLLPNNGNEKNWAIAATPVPEIEAKEEDQTPVAIGENGETTMGDLAKFHRAEAKKKADAMEREIADQLAESNYAAIQRDVIFDACRVGTGVLKGPVLIGRERRVWQEAEPGTGVFELNIVKDQRPRSKYVNPLFWYPDMSATLPCEREFDFEISFITKRALRDLLKYPKETGYIKSQIKKALKLRPEETQNDLTDFYDQVRRITKDNGAVTDSRYYLLEYYGPVKRDHLLACGCDPETLDEDQDEPFGSVIMVGDVVIKADIHPMAKGESIYDSFNWEESESSLFGYGVPYQMETEQRVINAAYRMVIDNGGLATGPQVLFRKGYVTPVDGNYNLTPRKMWRVEEAMSDVKLDDIIKVFDIPCRLSDLMAIADKFRQLSDEVTNLPLIAQGEQTGNITQTFQGMSLLMNSANIVIRRAVKVYDDWITKPHITRYYDWNMEFNNKPDIKGDLEVIARGTSSLLQREQEINALQGLIQLTPAFQGLPNMEEIWRRFLELNSLDPDVYTLPADQRQQEGPPPDPDAEYKMAKLQNEAQYDQAKLQLEDKKLAQEFQIRMSQIATTRDLTLEQLYKKLGMEQQKIDSNSEIKALESMNFQNEMALKMEMGQGI